MSMASIVTAQIPPLALMRPTSVIEVGVLVKDMVEMTFPNAHELVEALALQ